METIAKIASSAVIKDDAAKFYEQYNIIVNNEHQTSAWNDPLRRKIKTIRLSNTTTPMACITHNHNAFLG